MYTINVIRVIHILIDLAIYFDYLNIIRLIIYPIANHINTPIHTHTHTHTRIRTRKMNKENNRTSREKRNDIHFDIVFCVQFFFRQFSGWKKIFIVICQQSKHKTPTPIQAIFHYKFTTQIRIHCPFSKHITTEHINGMLLLWTQIVNKQHP